MRLECRKVLIWISCPLLLVSMAMAEQKVKAKDSNSAPGARIMSAGVSIFLDRDRDIIRRHYLTRDGALPPGLAKRHGELPPGLEKQLRRNGHLPPGLEKKLHPFPLVLERRLPPLRPGLVRGMIGVHAVIIDKKTSLILDIFKLL